ncbi:MAG: hypothetical protein JWP15_630 [Alphaproteobacteria bacterium]|nr:hypothetical protein [Alphaproteobacteria bacterium]
MAYQGLKARRAALQATLDRIDSGVEPLDDNGGAASAQATTGEFRADIQRQIDELDRLIGLPGPRG